MCGNGIYENVAATLWEQPKNCRVDGAKSNTLPNAQTLKPFTIIAL